jgi:hypothetical protein
MTDEALKTSRPIMPWYANFAGDDMNKGVTPRILLYC